MTIKFLLDVFREGINKPAILWGDKPYTYGWMLQHVNAWLNELSGRDIPPGSVVIFEADYSPNAVALFLALIEHSCILVPLAAKTETRKAELIAAVQGEYRLTADDWDRIAFERLPHQAIHQFYATLCRRGHPGLVLFSSGPGGTGRAALHDLTGLLEKYKVRRQARRAIPFLPHDHIGGINTLLHVLSNHGTLVVVQERSPEAVLAAVEKHKVELLPASRSFIEQMLGSETCQRHDLRSLQMVTHSEPMSEETLRRFHETFPSVAIKQAYGLAEVGILRSKAKEPASPWIKVGGEGFETRVVDGVLQIKSQSAMLGYLNAPSPFSEDGWFVSGDAVEVNGEYLHIMERQTGDERR